MTTETPRRPLKMRRHGLPDDLTVVADLARGGSAPRAVCDAADRVAKAEATYREAALVARREPPDSEPAIRAEQARRAVWDAMSDALGVIDHHKGSTSWRDAQRDVVTAAGEDVQRAVSDLRAALRAFRLEVGTLGRLVGRDGRVPPLPVRQDPDVIDRQLVDLAETTAKNAGHATGSSPVRFGAGPRSYREGAAARGWPG